MSNDDTEEEASFRERYAHELQKKNNRVATLAAETTSWQMKEEV
jgi:uncharacterized protein YeaO (DUF488 family)